MTVFFIFVTNLLKLHRSTVPFRLLTKQNQMNFERKKKNIQKPIFTNFILDTKAKSQKKNNNNNKNKQKNKKNKKKQNPPEIFKPASISILAKLN